MNKIEQLHEAIKPHILNHQGKDVEIVVRVEGVGTFQLTGDVSTWGKYVVLFAKGDKLN